MLHADFDRRTENPVFKKTLQAWLKAKEAAQ